MKLKNRMVISFFVIILVPLILTGVAVAGFTMYQVWSLEKNMVSRESLMKISPIIPCC